jgi:hypothetical protein
MQPPTLTPHTRRNDTAAPTVTCHFTPEELDSLWRCVMTRRGNLSRTWRSGNIGADNGQYALEDCQLYVLAGKLAKIPELRKFWEDERATEEKTEMNEV